MGQMQSTSREAACSSIIEFSTCMRQDRAAHAVVELSAGRCADVRGCRYLPW